ncbi:MAG: pilus assembly protein N-terminal domain-containing protein [Cyanobacteria bacterium]|nr:pilus assembly protein N-terminal domain-containing protein [Cyanobacteriota bacterium]
MLVGQVSPVFSDDFIPLRQASRQIANLGSGSPLTISPSMYFPKSGTRGTPSAYSAAGEGATSAKASVAALRVLVKRSQIIKFAQPITRLAIADPSLADIIPLAPDQFMINGKSRGVTSLIVWDSSGQEGFFDLFVENDTTQVLNAVKNLAPNENIQVQVTDDSLIVTGQATNTVILDEVRRLVAGYGYRDNNFIDLTETPDAQVMLEVKVAEVSRNLDRTIKTGVALPSNKRLGLSRLLTLPQSGGSGGGTPPITPGTLGTRAFGINGVIVPQVTTSNIGGLVGSGIISLGANHFISNIQYAFDLLQTNGLANVLAQPTLMCTHGRTASFLAGGEFPFVQGTDQNGSPLISFREFGVRLKFTPFVAVRTNRIQLRVQPEVSAIDTGTAVQGAGGGLVPGLTKRSFSTTVNLEDGESLVIAGLFSRGDTETFAKIPWIGDLPILGQFFKNNAVNKTGRELVVVVTPHIVRQKDYGRIIQPANTPGTLSTPGSS